MPSANPNTIKISGQYISPGKRFDFGVLQLSEQEIIDFAKVADPLPIHIDPAAGKNSPFGSIIASGAQLFIEFHKRYWIPAFQDSIVAGLAIRNWIFLKPHFPDMKVRGLLDVHTFDYKPEKKSAIVFWKYTFTDENGETIQEAEFEVLHLAEVA